MRLPQRMRVLAQALGTQRRRASPVRGHRRRGLRVLLRSGGPWLRFRHAGNRCPLRLHDHGQSLRQPFPLCGRKGTAARGRRDRGRRQQGGPQLVATDAQDRRLESSVGRSRRGSDDGGPARRYGPVHGKTCLLLDGQRVVRVRYKQKDESPDDPPHTVWLRLGPAPAETFVPSILWFLLKIGLFLVGAIVFWKRPEDRSAGAVLPAVHRARSAPTSAATTGGASSRSRCCCWCSWCAALLLPAVSLHFYLLFPRPKAFLERWPRRVAGRGVRPAAVVSAAAAVRLLHIRLLYQAAGEGPLPDVAARCC